MGVNRGQEGRGTGGRVVWGLQRRARVETGRELSIGPVALGLRAPDGKYLYSVGRHSALWTTPCNKERGEGETRAKQEELQRARHGGKGEGARTGEAHMCPHSRPFAFMYAGKYWK